MTRYTVPATLALMLLATPAIAHPGHEQATFMDGLLHPVGGLDHLAAMVAVGLWAGLAGGTRRWAWPATFVGAMMLGAVAGWSALATPGIELAIALSVVGFGAAIALGWAPSMALGAVGIALFGAAHGFAHGAEMSGGQLLTGYAGGFMLATAALHVLGLAGALLALRTRLPRLAPRLAGGALAGFGLVLVAGTMLA